MNCAVDRHRTRPMSDHLSTDGGSHLALINAIGENSPEDFKKYLHYEALVISMN